VKEILEILISRMDKSCKNWNFT